MIDLIVTLFSEASTQSRAHHMLHDSLPIVFQREYRCGDSLAQGQRELRDAYADGAIPGLPNHLVVAHFLRSEYFDDPADLARLPAVSRAMRDTMVDTGLEFEELHELRVVYLGCLSAVQRLQRRGLLPRQEHLCLVAARSGNLEKLKALRENYWPWDEGTCAAAAQGGHLEVLQWTRANGCPWDEMTCNYARNGENPDLVQWLRTNNCPGWEHYFEDTEYY